MDDNLAFLDQLGDGYSKTGILKAVLGDEQVCHISDKVCPYKLLDKCPLLYHSFEFGSQSRSYASIAAPSRLAVISLLRYCYTGNYLSHEAEYEPIRLLPHVELYKLATDLDMPGLQLLINGNFSCQIEFCCYSPTPPVDLFETIRFVYEHYDDRNSRQENNLVDSLVNYCISQFIYHELGSNQKFLDLISNLPTFHQDLCRANIQRNFQDESSLSIIQLCLEVAQTHFGDRPTTLASRNLPQEMLLDSKSEATEVSCSSISNPVIKSEEENHECKSDIMDEATDQQDTAPVFGIMLVHRPKAPSPISNTDLEDDDLILADDWDWIKSRESMSCSPVEEVMSSPEIVPSASTDVLAATGSNYPSDDEWNLI